MPVFKVAVRKVHHSLHLKAEMGAVWQLARLILALVKRRPSIGPMVTSSPGMTAGVERAGSTFIKVSGIVKNSRYEPHISFEHNLIPHFGHGPMTLHLVVVPFMDDPHMMLDYRYKVRVGFSRQKS